MHYLTPFLPVCGVPLNHKITRFAFFFQSVSWANTFNTNAPPLVTVLPENMWICWKHIF
jgi:hypothetical protein